MKKILVILPIAMLIAVCTSSVRAQSFENDFVNPPMKYRPFVWWHWMGSNFSLTGITKDLEAMKEVGIGGATIFNLSSAVQETQAPTLNNPWPWQTYRSPAYWKAIEFACQESERLGIELGLHNTVGYSTTGGPWIDEDKGMKRLIYQEVKIEGGKKLTIDIPKPEMLAYKGWGASKKCPTKYDEIVVVAVPGDSIAAHTKIYNLSKNYDKNGKIVWKAPKGRWSIFRIGYASTMSCPHPVPDELIGKVMEVNKIDSEYTAYHWNQVLIPLKEHIGQYFGKCFRHVLIDSYEAGNQNWSRNFKSDFIRLKGYDPDEMLPFAVVGKNDTLICDKDKATRFNWDFSDVIAQLYQKNGWQVAKDKLSKLGLQLNHEPYTGPFSTIAGAALADIPMGEFWTHGTGMINKMVTAGARAAGRSIIGAEAFTSAPTNSMWTEDPAMLKKTTEGAFASGVNRLYLHQWVHQAFDDRYQPGMSMGWWGTHFSRYQPWIKPGKAYFAYIGRCQYLLQQGEQVIDFLALNEAPDLMTDAITTNDFLNSRIIVSNGDVVLSSGRRYRIMHFPQSTAMLPEILDKLAWLVENGATVVAQKPSASPSLTNYPQCDEQVKVKADNLWSRYAGKRIFPTREEAMRAISLTPDYQNTEGNASVVHRHSADGDIYYIGNLNNRKQNVAVSLRISGMLPELWNAENGERTILENWKYDGGRTVVSLTLEPYQSRFIVMRRQATSLETAQGSAEKSSAMTASMIVNGKWNVRFDPKLDSAFTLTMDSLRDFSESVDDRVKYFTGTATYEKIVKLTAKQLSSSRIMLNLGEMNDIAELTVNGVNVGVLWYPPYTVNITKYLKKGKNLIGIAVTDNWANRMIGDEQYDADFEWGTDRGVRGRAMNAYPDWFIKGQPRLQPKRKTFCVWYYYHKDSKLNKAGLDGPVSLEFWNDKQ
jgi:hypothetical protein